MTEHIWIAAIAALPALVAALSSLYNGRSIRQANGAVREAQRPRRLICPHCSRAFFK